MESEIEDRLSRITTIWTTVRNVHGSTDDDRRAAFEKLFERYHHAAYRYLLGATHDPDVAEDLFQEFAARLCNGKFASADPDKGRFRNFLRTALINLINDHRRSLKRTSRDFHEIHSFESSVDPELDQLYLDTLRDELLLRTWSMLQQSERQSGRPYFTVLHARVTKPELSSDELAAWVNQQSASECQGKTRSMTPAGVRKTLQRARAYFAGLLMEEISQRIGSHDIAAIEQELIELGLHVYCKDELKRRGTF